MAKRIEYKFAEIDSKEEIVVHLGNLRDEISLAELAELLAMPQSQILVHMAQARNWHIARELYKTVREKVTDPETGATLPDGLPIEAELEFQEVTEQLLVIYNHWGPGVTWNWPLPKEDLYLPLFPYLIDQLKLLYMKGPRANRIYGIRRADTAAPVEDYRLAVERLESAMSRRAASVWTGYAELFAGLGLARSAVTMQQQHWSAEREFGAITESSFEVKKASLDRLSDALGDVEEAAADEFDREAFTEERNAALDLLRMLRATGPMKPLHVVIEAAFTARETLMPEYLDPIVDYTFRACNALARSCEAEQFTHEHVGDILLEAGKNLTPQAKEILEREGGRLGAEVVAEWDATILALRQGLECSERPISPLRWVQRGVRTYRLGLSSVSSILEQGVVAQVMVALRKGFGMNATVTKVNRGISYLILRSLANSAVQHREKEGELFLAKGERLSKILKTIEAMEDEVSTFLKGNHTFKEAGAFWQAKGAQLKSLQVRPVPRSGAGAAFRSGVSFVAFVLVLEPVLKDPSPSSKAQVAAWCGLVGGALAVTEHGLRAMEFAYARVPPLKLFLVNGTKDFGAFDRWMKVLSGAAALAGAVGNGLRALSASERGKGAEVFFETGAGVANFSVAVGQFAMAIGSAIEKGKWARWAGVCLRLGAVANVAGVAIGLALFAAQLVYDHLTNVGMRPVLLSLIDTLMGLPRAEPLTDRLMALRRIAEDSNTALTELESIPGGPFSSGARPTFWTAATSGFSMDAIVLMFRTTDYAVRAHVGPFFDANKESEGESP
jgi:hypothetical protein